MSNDREIIKKLMSRLQRLEQSLEAARDLDKLRTKTEKKAPVKAARAPRRSKRAKPVMERLGLKLVDDVTKQVCLQRVRELKRNIEKGKYDDDKALRGYAVYYKNWYKWKAKQLSAKKSKRRAA